MNILIAADSANAKVYKNVLKKAPDTNVLGAVTVIKADFPSELKAKWHPHILIADASVRVKKAKLQDIIETISRNYPYIKIIVITDETDPIPYPVYAVIKNQISDTDFITLLQKANQDEVYRGVAAVPSKKNVPEKAQNFKVDNLSTSADMVEHKDFKVNLKKIKKKRTKLNYKYIFVLVIALTVCLLVFIISIISLKACNSRTQSPSSNDEIIPSEQAETQLISEDYSTSVEVQETEINQRIAATAFLENAQTQILEESQTAENSTYVSSESSSNKSESRTSTSKASSTVKNSQSVNINNQRPIYSSSNSVIQVSGISLNYISYTIVKGKQFTLSVYVFPENAADKTVYWTTNNSGIATVNNGFVSGKSPGTAVITARAGNKTASCTVTVTAPETVAAEKDSRYISPASKTISKNETLTVMLINGSNCSWNISNPGVVAIVKEGDNYITIRAKKSGITNVVATANGKAYKSKITVK